MPDEDRQARSHIEVGEVEWSSLAKALGFGPRMSRVARALFDGKVGDEICRDLGFKKSALHRQEERLFRKLGIHTKLELAGVLVNALLEIRSASSGGESVDK